MKIYKQIFILVLTINMNAYSQFIFKEIKYDNGEKRFIGKIDTLNKLKIGVWKEFYPNGKIKSLKKCSSDKTEKPKRNSRLSDSIDDIQEFKDYDCWRTGVWIDYYENEQISWGRHYDDGYEIGLNVKYYENGNIKETGNYYKMGTIFTPPKTGEWKGYFEDGTLQWVAHYDKSIKIGEWKEYYNNENLKKIIPYNNGKVNGLWKYFYENGNVQIIATMKSSIQAGETEEYFDNKQLHVKKLFESDGRLKSILEYFDKEGNVLDKGTLQNGNGTFKIYDSKNVLVNTLYYENGKEKKK